MIEKIIYNNENGILKFITALLNEPNKSKSIVFSQIDDQALESIDECFSEKIEAIYMTVDRYLTTKKIFQKLLISDKYVNKYVSSNSELDGNRLNNLIVLESDKQLEVLFIPFCMTTFNLATSNSFAIYLACDISEASHLNELCESYINKSEYDELTENYINGCEEKKLFRNEKANTVYKDVNKDEVIQSFRSITDSDDVDETLKVIQSQASAKKFSLDKSEMSFNITDDDMFSNYKATFNDDFEIDIEI